FLLSLLDVLPRGERRNPPQKRRQKYEQNGHAVRAHLVARADDWNPLRVFEELEAARAAVVSDERERDYEVEREPRGCELLNRAALPLVEEEEDDERADSRKPGDYREQIGDFHNSSQAAIRTKIKLTWVDRMSRIRNSDFKFEMSNPFASSSIL